MAVKIEVVTSRKLIRATRRRYWYAVSGFAPYVYRGQLYAGFCTMFESVERRRHRDDAWGPWRDEGGEG